MSATSVEQCIRDYLKQHDGTAPAGEVTAHATAAGFAASTVRRVADRIVTKTRQGNTFAWSLKPAPKFAPSTTPAQVMPSRPGRLIDKNRRLTLQDAWKHNGQTVEHDPAPRFVAPMPTERRARLSDSTDEPEPEPAWESEYARMDQAERLHLIAQRPTLAEADYIHDDLTEIEAIVILEADDEGLYELPAARGGIAISAANLPY